METTDVQQEISLFSPIWDNNLGWLTLWSTLDVTSGCNV